MRGLALCSIEWVRVATTPATFHTRPRWVYIAHTRKLAVGSKVPEKSGQSVVPAANGRSYRSGSNGYKTSRWTPNRNDRQPTPGRTAARLNRSRSADHPILNRELQTKMHTFWFSSTANKKAERPVCGCSAQSAGTTESHAI